MILFNHIEYVAEPPIPKPALTGLLDSFSMSSFLYIFFYSHIIIKKMGINTIFIIGQLAFIIRTFLYGLLNENT